jgi:hypothetical protein
MATTTLAPEKTAKDTAIQALADQFLSEIGHVSLVEQSKCVNFLLDLRNICEGEN